MLEIHPPPGRKDDVTTEDIQHDFAQNLLSHQNMWRRWSEKNNNATLGLPLAAKNCWWYCEGMGYYAALEDSVPWYSRLTQDLPQLARNWLMKYYDNASHGSQFKKEIPVESNKQLLAYQWHFLLVRRAQKWRADYSSWTRCRDCRIKANEPPKTKPRSFTKGTKLNRRYPQVELK